MSGASNVAGGEVAAATAVSDEHDLRQLLLAVWRSRRLVLALAALFGAVGAAYSFLATPWYRAEVLMVQSKDRGMDGLMSQFGGLASLAGLNLGGTDDAESMAVLKSRGFAQGFIEARDLETVLLAHKWDSRNETWKGDEEDWPDVRDAVDYFDKKVRRVSEDRKTGVVTLAVQWRDPVLAAEWANDLAARLNDQMRTRAIAETTENVRYLKEEIATSNLVALKQPIGKLLELELQKLMLARNNEQYSYRIVDSAKVPKKPIRPQKVANIAVSVLLGLLFGVLAAVVVHWMGAGSASARQA